MDLIPASLVATEVAQLRAGRALWLPLYLSRVPAGAPTPGDDHAEQLDLQEMLVQHPASTFFVRVEGDSMVEAGIHSGDILVVDRAVEPTSGDVVIAALDGDLTVKRLLVERGRLYLVPENEAHEPIAVAEGQDVYVWGVVQHVIHKVT